MRTTRLTGGTAPACLSVILTAPVLMASVLTVLSSAPAAAQEIKTSASRISNANGSAALNASGSLDMWSWTRLGVDLSVPMAGGSSLSQAAVPAAGQLGNGSGTAWASLNIPGVARLSPWEQGKVDLRVDPLADSTRIATEFSRRWALTEHISATFNDSYALTRSADGGQGWETGKSVGLAVTDWGTSFRVGTSASSGTRSWSPSLTASQTLIGPLQVSTTIASDEGNLNRSVTAGFSRKW